MNLWYLASAGDNINLNIKLQKFFFQVIKEMKIAAILYPQWQIVLIFILNGICFDRASFPEDLLTYLKS